MDAGLLKPLIGRYKTAMFTVNRRLNALMRERMPQDLTLEQYATIQYIRSRDRCTSSELADIFCVGKSSITAITNRLFDKQMLHREPDRKDRRVTYLLLTEEGERLADEIDTRIEELLSQHIDQFDDDEAEQFIRTFEKLAGVLMQSGDEAESAEGGAE